MDQPIKDSDLTAYWFSFPEDPDFPVGLGVTGYSVDDALSLLAERYDFVDRAKKIVAKEGVTMDSIEYSHVAPNAGPRGLGVGED